MQLLHSTTASLQTSHSADSVCTVTEKGMLRLRTELAAGIVGSLHALEGVVCVDVIKVREQASANRPRAAAAAPAVHIQHLPGLHPCRYLPHQLSHPVTVTMLRLASCDKYEFLG